MKIQSHRMKGKHSLPAGAQLSVRLKQTMTAQGLSGATLAEHAGVKPSFIYDILHGKSLHPSSIMLSKVASALGVTVSDLVQDSSIAGAADAPHVNGARGEHAMVVVAPLRNGKNGGHPGAGEALCQFNEEWLQTRLGVAPGQLRIFTVSDDSMEPTLHNGDWVLVDVSKKEPSPPGLFAVFDGYAPVIKRLEYTSVTPSATVQVMADNARYASRDMPLSELHIIGRIVWFCRAL